MTARAAGSPGSRRRSAGRKKAAARSTGPREIELRAGDRIRWTRNDAGLGLVNSRTAEVVGIANGRVTFRLEDGKTLELGKGDPQFRHLDPCLGLDRARLPGPHGGQCDRGDGGAPPASHHAEELLCRDQPGARPAPSW